MSEAQVYIQCYALYFLMVVSGLLAFFYYFTNIVLTDIYHLLIFFISLWKSMLCPSEFMLIFSFLTCYKNQQLTHTNYFIVIIYE